MLAPAEYDSRLSFVGYERLNEDQSISAKRGPKKRMPEKRDFEKGLNGSNAKGPMSLIIEAPPEIAPNLREIRGVFRGSENRVMGADFCEEKIEAMYMRTEYIPVRIVAATAIAIATTLLGAQKKDSRMASFE